MGEPANPTPTERAERQKIAAAIVESVRNDEKMPLPGLKVIVYTATSIDHSARGIAFDCLAVEEFVLKLAQEITILLDEKAGRPTEEET
jgi:hypothetical protein